jgi:proton-dependent oligopeptide transporter, POT family
LAPELAAPKALPIGEAFGKLVQFTGESPEKLTQVLYHSHHVGLTWYVFAAIGVSSAVMIYFYGRWILKLAQKEEARPGCP